ncbi:MAG: D-alanyl-D-alanine carboxypeptidase family protein, partial [Candidatus Dormibacteraceae bacterium]
SSQVTVSPAAAQMPPDVMGLSAGEVVSVRDLMYGIFLDSGNDAAEALADGIVPHATFISLMNKKVRAMGLTRTHFTDPTGLDAPGHYSSAHDLAVIAATLMSAYPELLPIIATEQIMLPATATHKAFNASNLNKLLRTYSGAIGMKTGFTDNAGGCVVAVAVRGGRHLLAVVLDSDIFFTEAAQLLDYGFSTPT